MTQQPNQSARAVDYLVEPDAASPIGITQTCAAASVQNSTQRKKTMQKEEIETLRARLARLQVVARAAANLRGLYPRLDNALGQLEPGDSADPCAATKAMVNMLQSRNRKEKP